MYYLFFNAEIINVAKSILSLNNIILTTFVIQQTKSLNDCQLYHLKLPNFQYFNF